MSDWNTSWIERIRARARFCTEPERGLLEEIADEMEANPILRALPTASEDHLCFIKAILDLKNIHINTTLVEESTMCPSYPDDSIIQVWWNTAEWTTERVIRREL